MDHGQLSLSLLRRRAENEPDRPFVADIDHGEQTYGEFHLSTLRWAQILERLGVNKGDPVASLLPNSIDALRAWLGAGWLGAVHIPLNTQLIARPLAHALNLTTARVLVTTSAFLPQIERVQGELTELKTVVVIDAVDVGAPRPFEVLPAVDLLDPATPPGRQDPQPTDIHAGIFTSGTTGQSKCALVTWGALEDNGRWLLPTSPIEEMHTGSYYNPWPDYHALSLAAFPAAIQRGLRLVLRPAFSIGGFWKDVRAYECTHAVLLVTAPLLLNQPPADDDDRNPLQHVTIVPATTGIDEFEKRFAVRAGSIYGMTETGPVMYTERAAEHRGGGRPVPGLEVEIRDPDDHPVGADQLGQLVVRPADTWRISKTYLGLPAEMAQRWKDGWFYTGDAFIVDPYDRYHFVDRLKDCVRTRGHNVSSIEVEVEVVSHPAVLDCACVGVQSDSAFGEEDVMIYVVPRPSDGPRDGQGDDSGDGPGDNPGGDLDEADLHRYLSDRLPRFMMPRYIALVPELPRTPTLKVRKDILRTLGPTASAWVSGG